ncbi:MAG: TIGR04063 family PEP-CTERM/XrtA system glycosyltransferase [Pontixanthobacter sp.]
MTRVLHILDHSLPLQSGYTFRTRAILKAQQAAGLEVRGITGQRHNVDMRDAAFHLSKPCRTDADGVEWHDGIAFHRTQGEPEGPVGLREWREIADFADALEALVRRWRPDVLHAHSPALCGHAAMRMARKLDIPFVYEIRAFWEDAAVGNGTGGANTIKYRLTRALENRVVAGADAVFTICEGLRGDLIARGFDSARIGVSPNGVDMAMFGAPTSRDDGLAANLGLTKGPVIGFIGSFYDYEGLDDLIATMPGLRVRHPDAQLLLIGGGPRDAALHAQAAAGPAEDAIHFAGRVPHCEVERYYPLIDILAYPRKASRLTDLVTPLKPLEAMAQGRICAASDVGGHRELIAHGETGVLFPADDPARMATALADLIDARTDWPALRERARVHVADHHDWAKNVGNYLSVYHRLVATGRNGTGSQAA